MEIGTVATIHEDELLHLSLDGSLQASHMIHTFAAPIPIFQLRPCLSRFFFHMEKKKINGLYPPISKF